MKKLLIVDGMNLHFQMFYGMPSRIINTKGKAIQGVLGFIGALIKIIKMINPTHIVVLFDGEHPNDRANLYNNYKTNRKDFSKEEDSPFSQLQDVYYALSFMNIKYKEVTSLEADDFIASYAYTYKNIADIVIVSFDSDFFQLINDNVSVLRYRGAKTILCDKQFLYDKYNISPDQYVDFKSLTGDNSDNIKGAEKIGIKTASALLNRFNNLKNIFNNVNEIKKSSIRDSIIRNTERLKTNYKLIKLENRAKLPYTFDNLSFNYNSLTTKDVLKGIKLI